MPQSVVPALAPPLTKDDICTTRQPSMKFASIGIGKKAPYFSPLAENVGIAAADMVVLRKLHGLNKLRDLECCRAGFFVDCSHQVVFKDVAAPPGQHGGRWLVGLHHFKDSACLAWPVSLVTVPDEQALQYLVFDEAVSPTIVAITNIKDIECFSFSWRSWAWQIRNINDVGSHLRPAIRAFKSSEITSVHTLAAKCGWWTLPRSVLEQVSEDIGGSMDGCSSTFDVLYYMTKTVLKCSEEEVLAALEHRLGDLATATEWGGELLEVDEAAKCLREEDRSDIKKEVEQLHTRKTELTEFRSCYGAKKASLRTTGSGKQSKRRPPWKGPSKVSYEHLNQKQAKDLLPPGAFLWRARSSGSWNARYSTMPSRSCRDTAWGSEQEALRECLRHAWKDLGEGRQTR